MSNSFVGIPSVTDEVHAKRLPRKGQIQQLRLLMVVKVFILSHSPEKEEAAEEIWFLTVPSILTS